MPVKVNGKYLLPAPLVQFEKNYIRTPNGEKIGAGFNFTLQGTIIPNKGNPIATSGGVSFSSDAWTTTYTPEDDDVQSNSDSDLLSTTINKIEAIRDVFANPSGNLIEILGFDSTRGLKFYGTTTNISFGSESRWANPTQYTVTLFTNNFIDSPNSYFTAHGNEDDFNYYIVDAQEDWSFQELPQSIINSGDYTQVYKIYQITHNISAVGAPVYSNSGTYFNGEPWQQASGYVRSKTMGSGSNPINILLPAGYGIANHSFTENINKLGASYSLSETFFMYNTGLLPFPVIDTIIVDSSIGEDGLTTIQVNGTIEGMESNSPYGSDKNKISKYNNASGYYTYVPNILMARVKNITGLDWIHPKPLSQSVSRNVGEGSISYTYSFDNRPPNLVPNSISENISISDNYPGQLFSATPVIGRSQPVLQYLNSRSEYSRTLSINVNMGRFSQNWNTSDVNSSGYWTNATSSGVRIWLINNKPSLLYTSSFSGIFEAANPANEIGVNALKVFYSSPKETWEPRRGAYSYEITWTYERT